MNVLKNYKVLKQGGFEEYPAVEIRYNDSDVFDSLPICAIPYGTEFKEPLLLSRNQIGIASIVEKSILIKHLKEKTQTVYFELDNQNNPKITDKKTDIFMRLPIENDPNKYIYDYREGQIFVIEIKNEDTEEVFTLEEEN